LVAGRFEEHIILISNSIISQVPTVYRERQNHYKTKPYGKDCGYSSLGPSFLGAATSRFWGNSSQVLIEDIIPMIDATYRTIPDRPSPNTNLRSGIRACMDLLNFYSKI
jgi:hypothetical protein